MRKIILSADSACDIPPELLERFNVHLFYFHIQLGGHSYIDTLEITPPEIYAAWREKGLLPQTAAISPGDYLEFFAEWVAAGYDVVHVNIGSTLSCSYQNCCLAASELGHIYPVDSANLSTGISHLVLKAGEMIEAGLEAGEIQERLHEMRPQVQASFLLDTLEFMAAGGRCSTLLAGAAALLKIKPCIEVKNQEGGRLVQSKKYRGSMDKALKTYVQDQLEVRDDLDLTTMFIAYSGGSPESESDVAMVKEEIAKYAAFKNVYAALAGCTISCHCGPRTLGLIYMTKQR